MRLTEKHLLFYHSILYHVTVYRQSHLNSSFLKNYATLVTFYCSGAIADFNTKLHTTVRNSAILYFNVSGILTLVLSGSGNLILFFFFFPQFVSNKLYTDSSSLMEVFPDILFCV